MPRFAQILFDTDPESEEPLASGTVINLPEASEDFAAEQGWIACADDVAIGWRWDGESFAAPVVPIGDRKAAMRAEVNAIKAARMNGVAPTPAGPVDCDPQSQARLTGLALMASLTGPVGDPFTTVWTLADNTGVTLDGPGLIAVVSAVTAHVSACHDHAQALKAAIGLAGDHAALDAIDIAAGWPGDPA